MGSYEEYQSRVLATMTEQQRKAKERGAEVVIILGRVYVKGVDKWPYPPKRKPK